MNLSKDIYKRVRKVLIDRGIKDTNVSIAELAGVSEGTVRNWKGGTEIKVTDLVSLANNLNIPVDLLLGSKVPATSIQNSYGGGQGTYDTALDVEFASEEDWSYVKRTVQENHHIRIFKVVGNSMIPTLWDTDILFCFEHRMGVDAIRDSNVYVVESEPHGGFLVKRIIDRKDGTIRLYSDNKDGNSTFPLNLETEVLSLWRVRTKMTWQLGVPVNQSLDERISKLEKLIK